MHSHAGHRPHDDTAHRLAQGLGWFSIGLGLAELLAPEGVTRPFGMERHTALIRAYGLREIAAGVGILTQPDPTPWVWGRVAGDALDIATMAAGLSPDNPRRGNVAVAIAGLVGITALDAYCAQRLAAEREQAPPREYHYGDRSGFPRAPASMRGAARDFEVPRDFRTPEALRPYATA
jgi:hypothetical protein